MSDLLPSSIFTLAGFLGAGLYLGAYAGLSLGFLKSGGYLYLAMNLVASSCVLLSLTVFFNPFSAFIEVSWLALSIVGILRLWVLSRGLDLTADERMVVETALPGASRVTARQLFRAGEWADLPRGHALTVQDSPVDRISFLASGSARVLHDGVEVARLQAGRLVGELGVLSRVPATATVVVDEPARTFSVTSEALARLVEKFPDLRLALDAGIGRDVRAKLIGANRRLSAGGQAA